MIFSSEKHLNILQDKENVASIGGSNDELIRHHPSLKSVVFKSLLSTLGKLEDLGNLFCAKQYCILVYMSLSNSSNSNVPMEDIQHTDSSNTKASTGDEV